MDERTSKSNYVGSQSGVRSSKWPPESEPACGNRAFADNVNNGSDAKLKSMPDELEMNATNDENNQPTNDARIDDGVGQVDDCRVNKVVDGVGEVVMARIDHSSENEGRHLGDEGDSGEEETTSECSPGYSSADLERFLKFYEDYKSNKLVRHRNGSRIN